MSELSRKEKDAEYFFRGVQLLESSVCGYVLVGKIVKKTTLEIYSDIDAEGCLYCVNGIFLIIVRKIIIMCKILYRK